MSVWPPRPDAGDRLFRLLLWLYPPEFRRRFGDEMTEFFRARRSDQGMRGRGASLRLWAHLLADIAINAPALHLHAALARRTAMPPATSRSVPWSEPDYPAESRPMDALLQDVKFALRTLARRPGFALVATLTLALCIGATTAIYSVVDAVIVRPLPWPNADRIVTVNTTRDGQFSGTAFLDYRDWAAGNRTFQSLGVYRGQSVNLTGRDTPERLFGTFSDASYLRIIGARAAHGRLFTDDEADVAKRVPVAVVSHAFWQRHYGGNRDSIGARLILNGQAFTMIGVLPDGYRTPFGAVDVFMPIGFYPNRGDLDTRGRGGVAVIGRLAPGRAVTQAEADIGGIMAQLAERYPATNAGLGVDVQPLREQLVGSSRTQMYVMLAAVAIVLLIACANVANLQLARAASRRRELTVRSALGAGRLRLIRQLVTESLILSVAGGVLGVAIAWAGVRWLSVVVPNHMTVFGPIALDLTVLLFAAAVTLVTGLLFAMPPAWRASRVRLQQALTLRGTSGEPVFRRGRPLVFAQTALCVVLLVTAGLLTRTLIALTQVDPGFDPRGIVTMQFRLPPAKYDTEQKIATTFERMLSEVRALPDVRAAAFVRATPLNGNGESHPYEIEGRPAGSPATRPTAMLNLVSPGYYATMAIPRIAGRDFEAADRDGSLPVVIVNEQLARKIAPNGSAIGARLRLPDGESMRSFTVVGVVGNTRHFQVSEPQLDQAYLPIAQRPLIFTEVVIRTDADPAAVSSAAREAIWRVDRDQPVWGIRPLTRSIDGALGARQFTLRLLAGFAGLAVLLAMIGIYGVTSYAVSGRTQEMGIRMALGARGREVVGLVVGESMRTIGLAIVVGLIISAGAARLLESQLFGVGATDPVVYGLVPLTLGIVALAACWLPARRASRVDPVATLRAEG